MSSPSYSIVWTSARALAPVIVVVGVAALVFVPVARARAEVRQGAVPLPRRGGVHGPRPVPVRRANILLLHRPTLRPGGHHRLRYARAAARLLPVALLVVYTAFGFVWLDRGAIYRFGLRPYESPDRPAGQPQGLDQGDGTRSNTIAASPVMLERHSRVRYIWAGPDAPELYFLTNRQNPTRSFGGRLDDQTPQGRELLENLAQQVSRRSRSTIGRASATTWTS